MWRVLMVALVVVYACGDNRSNPDAGLGDAAVDEVVDAKSRCGNGQIDLGEYCDQGLRGLSGDGCSSTCRTEAIVVRTSGETMLPRMKHGLAYDRARERVVMFGGEVSTSSGTVISDETWELDGSTWTLRTPPNRPPARTDPAMFYESGRVILVGGTGHADTWVWDGTDWTEVVADTPPTGTIYGAAFDRQRNVGVLVTSSGTWEWNNSSWTQVTTSTVFARAVVYAGSGRVAAISESSFALWNGGTWSTTSTTGASVMTRSAAYDPSNDRVLMLGSADQSTDWGVALFVWGGSSWSRISSTEDAPFDRSTPIVFDESTNSIVLFGGRNVRGDTWAWNGTWTQHHASVPPPRSAAAFTYDSERGSILMISGVGQSTLRDDAWQYRDGQWSALNASPRPEPRVNLLASTYDEVRGRMILYGGQTSYRRDSITKVEDLWELDGEQWMQRVPATVVGQSTPLVVATAYDLMHEYTIIVTHARTLTWDGQTLVERSPPPGDTPSLAYDANRGVMVLLDESTIYEWTGAIWIDRGPVEPGELFYDPVRGRVVVMTATRGAWEWNGSTAVQLPVPQPLAAGKFVYDRGTRSWFQFGGASGWDTTMVRWESDEVDERCDGTDADLDGLVRCDDPDCWWRCTPRCPPYALCGPNAPRCGDGTCSQLEDAALCPSDCT